MLRCSWLVTDFCARHSTHGVTSEQLQSTFSKPFQRKSTLVCILVHKKELGLYQASEESVETGHEEGLKIAENPRKAFIRTVPGIRRILRAVSSLFVKLVVEPARKGPLFTFSYIFSY